MKQDAYWRSLEELHDTPAFQQLMQREFPDYASEWTDDLSRRRFLQLLGGAFALAGLNACTRSPHEPIVPYVRAPAAIVPGKSLAFATAMTVGTSAIGLVVRSYMGRPVKIEGNPQHPGSLGATTAYAQGALLTLYDPDRSQVVLHFGEVTPWSAFLTAFRPLVRAHQAASGAGLRILTESVISPTLAAQLDAILTALPEARWHQFEPVGNFNIRAGASLAFGQAVHPMYRFSEADVVLAFDPTMLTCEFGELRYVHDFAERRRLWADQRQMNRLYVAESTPSSIGAMADHRFPVRSRDIEPLVRSVAIKLGVDGVEPPAAAHLPVPDATLEVIVQDLQRTRGRSIVLVGEQQPPVVHALAHAINSQLGNHGHTVVYSAPIEARPVDQLASLRELVADMEDGRVETLLILGGNPVYTAPADFAFAERLQKVRTRIHLSLYNDETSVLCQWHLPEAHFLESWSDTRAFDGTASIVQPLIAPLYQGRTAHEVLALFSESPEQSSYDIVRSYWQRQITDAGLQLQPGQDFEQFWRAVLRQGIIPGTTQPLLSIGLTADPRTIFALPASDSTQPVESARPSPSVEIVFRPDPTIYDGRFANNGWLQELPKPLSSLTWDAVAYVSPQTAQRLRLQAEILPTGGATSVNVIELRYRDRRLRMPAWIMPGHADDSVTVHLGYGRTRAGSTGNNVGVNAYTLRTSAALWFDGNVELRRTRERYTLASTQLHHTMDGRDLVRATTLSEYQAGAAGSAAPHSEEHPSLYPEYDYSNVPYKWGMAIDLTTCTGCSACVIACQAENNIPIVGKEQIARGREMLWLRVDTYYRGDAKNPQTYYEPVPCMHCEKAPCEVVCPVAATVHGAEGLNDMVYNRCVGTRYCSNNCPYKVRRFNFLQYADFHPPPTIQMLRNPDVTVRSRGVMEKCTYCVQRIVQGRIEAEKANRLVRDGEIRTACQQVCPTGSIIFGNLNDPTAQVVQMKKHELHFGLLQHLNTQPRTTYLAAVRNPNPALAEPTSSDKGQQNAAT